MIGLRRKQLCLRMFLGFKMTTDPEIKKELKRLKQTIQDIQQNYHKYPIELDNALSNVCDRIED